MVWVTRDGFQKRNITDESKEDMERRKKDWDTKCYFRSCGEKRKKKSTLSKA